jgi:hypothetical protein
VTVETQVEANGHRFELRWVDGGWQVSPCLVCGSVDPRPPCEPAGR